MELYKHAVNSKKWLVSRVPRQFLYLFYLNKNEIYSLLYTVLVFWVFEKKFKGFELTEIVLQIEYNETGDELNKLLNQWYHAVL